MSDYTPTTQLMRDHFADSGWFVYPDGELEHNTIELEDMFDRWLAQIEKIAYLRGRADEFDSYASQGMEKE